VGVVRKVYGFANIAPGHLIAARGETGYQAEIIPPGTCASANNEDIASALVLGLRSRATFRFRISAAGTLAGV